MSDGRDFINEAIHFAYEHGFPDADIAQLELARGRATVSNQQEDLDELRKELSDCKERSVRRELEWQKWLAEHSATLTEIEGRAKALSEKIAKMGARA